MIESFYMHEVNAETYRPLYTKLQSIFSKFDGFREKKSGVYFIYNDKKELMYVGQSKNIASRLTTHIRGKYKLANRILIMEVNEYALDSIERFCINNLQPIDNIMVEEKCNMVTLEKYLQECDWSKETLLKLSNFNNSEWMLCLYPKTRQVTNSDFIPDMYGDVLKILDVDHINTLVDMVISHMSQEDVDKLSDTKKQKVKDSIEAQRKRDEREAYYLKHPEERPKLRWGKGK